MAEAVTPTSIEKPDIVVPDAAPLVHLASAGLLHLLHEVGGTVVVVDMVAHEITRDAAKPGARALVAWSAERRASGSDRPVRVDETETGRLYVAVLETRPDYRLRDGGETAIVEWLAERIAGTDRSVIVLYANGRVPTIVRNQSLDADIDVLTTRAFLDGAERRERPRPGTPGQGRGEVADGESKVAELQPATPVAPTPAVKRLDRWQARMRAAARAARPVGNA